MIDASDQGPLTRSVVELAEALRAAVEHGEGWIGATCQLVERLETTVNRLERVTEDLWGTEPAPSDFDDDIPF